VEDKLDNYFSTLRRLSQILLSRVMDSTVEFGQELKLSQTKALAAFREDRAFTMQELASNSMVKLPNMTTAVDSLIKEGFAERAKDENDRRRVLVSLTARGKQVRDQFLSNRRALAMTIFARLNDDQKNELLASLEKVCSLLEEAIEKE
jgi:DNA-binding MarR family transcriptional regulator